MVECVVAQKNRNVFVRVVVYGENGLSLSDCEKLHKRLLPVMESVVPAERDLSMELSSPGIDRVLKRSHEYAIFTGKAVKLYKKGSGESIQGVIDSAGDTGFRLRLGDSSLMEFSYDEIQKAKLND